MRNLRLLLEVEPHFGPRVHEGRAEKQGGGFGAVTVSTDCDQLHLRVSKGVQQRICRATRARGSYPEGEAGDDEC